MKIAKKIMNNLTKENIHLLKCQLSWGSTGVNKRMLLRISMRMYVICTI